MVIWTNHYGTFTLYIHTNGEDFASDFSADFRCERTLSLNLENLSYLNVVMV